MSRTRSIFGGLAVAGLITSMTVVIVSSPAQAQTVSKIKTIPVAAVVAETKTVAVGSTFVVKIYPASGSTLSSIARISYGDSSKWAPIYKANLSKIKNPNLLYPGMVLNVPTNPQAPAPVVAVTPPVTTPVPKAQNVAPVGFFNPLPGAALTSCFGPRWGTIHRGIDMSKPTGTPIHAVGSGTVVAAGWNYTNYGISVMIKMDSGGVYSHYAHMSKSAVSKGQHVNANQIIGYVGETGDATGPHLHFEIHQGSINWNHSQINPAPWLRAHGVKVGC